MIEDAINELNDIGVIYGELDNITEMSFEQTSHSGTENLAGTKGEVGSYSQAGRRSCEAGALS